MFRWVKELHEQRIEWVVTGTGATLLLAFLAVLAVVGGMAAGKNAAGDAAAAVPASAAVASAAPSIGRRSERRWGRCIGLRVPSCGEPGGPLGRMVSRGSWAGHRTDDVAAARKAT